MMLLKSASTEQTTVKSYKVRVGFTELRKIFLYLVLLYFYFLNLVFLIYQSNTLIYRKAKNGYINFRICSHSLLFAPLFIWSN